MTLRSWTLIIRSGDDTTAHTRRRRRLRNLKSARGALITEPRHKTQGNDGVYGVYVEVHLWETCFLLVIYGPQDTRCKM